MNVEERHFSGFEVRGYKLSGRVGMYVPFILSPSLSGVITIDKSGHRARLSFTPRDFLWAEAELISPDNEVHFGSPQGFSAVSTAYPLPVQLYLAVEITYTFSESHKIYICLLSCFHDRRSTHPSGPCTTN